MHEKENRVFVLWLAAYEEQLILVTQGSAPSQGKPAQPSSPADADPAPEVTSE